MRSIGIKNLKDHLSEYVRLAAGGETVLVTERDKVVAELTPPRPGRSDAVYDAHLAEAVRKGWMTPPLSALGPLPPRLPIARLNQLLDELSRDREDP